MSKEEFKKTIEELVAKFDRNVDRYKDQSSSFNETQLRIEFIDPMFEALGWDMNNKAGAAEQYKEVIHEDKVYIEGKPKAPDYSFKFWVERKFFLEAKQPFVKIKTDYKPALQLRRYAWSAHLPVSILSDFEELAIYDTTVEPKATDKASVARLQYYKYTDYLDKWEEIYDLFAKESIQQGSFDKFIAKEKRGSQLVDKVFLKEIENWREWLAKDIAKHNSELTVEQLNFAVQKIIDRIIFLRIAEDRGIERYKSLENIIKSKNSYPELVRYFKTAHEKYNSGLFDFEEDTITPELKVSDKLLDKILEHLYYPNSPYEFSVLGVELLGSIYEQFLGKVIRLTDGHNAKVEEKPEVKKAGGVFYTPQYIVEYIVKNTVGELLKGKSTKQAEKIKVLDPACGSGSFLIGAYEFLLNWHLAEYENLSDNEKEKLEKKGVIYKQVNKESTGESIESWQLTTNEKKRIMLNNIYGVDIDSQAVEVTKLSLALKMLENENQQSINKQMKLFAERILPDMSENIKCGNSLVGSDFYDTFPIEDLNEDVVQKTNVFDWQKEFKEIFDKGGFDAIVGNPPYIRVQAIEKNQKEYLNSKYKSATSNYDLYVLFIEKSLELMSNKARFSMILPNKFMESRYGEGVRDLLSSTKVTNEIIDFKDYQIFDTATTYTCILSLTNKKNTDFKYLEGKDFIESTGYIHLGVRDKDFSVIEQNELSNISWVLMNESDLKIFNKIKQAPNYLKDYTNKIFQGLKTGADKVYILEKIKDLGKTTIIQDSYTSEEVELESDLLYPLIKGTEMRAYEILETDKVILFPYSEGKLINPGKMASNFPKVFAYLKNHEKYLDKRERGRFKGKEFYQYSRSQALDVMWRTKVITPDLAPHPRFNLDQEGKYFFTGGASGGYGILVNDEKYILPLLGLLNSSLFDWYIKKSSSTFRGGFYSYESRFIRDFPTYEPERLKDIDTMVQKILDIKVKMSDSNNTVKQVLASQLEKAKDEIDQFIYQLYGLTKEEIDVIEAKNE
jgi:type I restriction-modification system DNA methylase subunit